MWAISWPAGRRAASPHPCHNAEFSVMLTYNTAYDLPGPSSLHSLSLARIPCTYRDESKSALFRAAHYVLPSHPIHLSRALASIYAVASSFFVSYVQKNNQKKTHPKHQKMLAGTRRLAPAFRLLLARGGGCASRRDRRRYWRRQRRACCLSGDWLLRVFIPEERGGDAAVF